MRPNRVVLGAEDEQATRDPEGPLPAALPDRDPGRDHRRRDRGGDQVRLERVPRDEDLVHQRDGATCARAVGADVHAVAQGDGARPAHRLEVPASRPRLRRVVLSEGHARGARVRAQPRRRAAHRALDDRGERGAQFRARWPRCARPRAAASARARSPCSASRSSRTPTTCANRPRSRSLDAMLAEGARGARVRSGRDGDRGAHRADGRDLLRRRVRRGRRGRRARRRDRVEPVPRHRRGEAQDAAARSRSWSTCATSTTPRCSRRTAFATRASGGPDAALRGHGRGGVHRLESRRGAAAARGARPRAWTISRPAGGRISPPRPNGRAAGGAAFELLEGDMRDVAGLPPRRCASADFVLHKAAIPSVPRSVQDPVAHQRSQRAAGRCSSSWRPATPGCGASSSRRRRRSTARARCCPRSRRWPPRRSRPTGSRSSRRSSTAGSSTACTACRPWRCATSTCSVRGRIRPATTRPSSRASRPRCATRASPDRLRRRRADPRFHVRLERRGREPPGVSRRVRTLSAARSTSRAATGSA